MFATAEDLNERRLRVLQLHVEELNRQAGTREAALTLAQARVKELERLRAASQPQERKLFAKVEQQQARRRPAQSWLAARIRPHLPCHRVSCPRVICPRVL